MGPEPGGILCLPVVSRAGLALAALVAIGPSKASRYVTSPSKGHVECERAGLDDDVVNGSAIAEDSAPLPQCPVDRSTAVEPDIQPFVKPAHQRRAELAPFARLPGIEH